MISLNTALPATGAEPPKTGVRPQDGQSKGSPQGDLQALFADLVAGLEAAVAGQQMANRPPTAPVGPSPTAPQAPVEAVLPGAAPDQPAEVLVKEALAQEALAQEALAQETQGLVALEAVPQAVPPAPALPSAPVVASLPLPPTQAPTLPLEAGREAALRAKKGPAAPTDGVLLQATPNAPRSEPNQRVELPRLRSAESIELAVQASAAMVDKATVAKNGDPLLAALQRSATGPVNIATSNSSGAEFRLDGLPTGAKPIQAEWAPMKVDTQQTQWGRDLAAALGDRLNMQVNQNVKEATVRLDPPEMGRIELVVRMDGDRLSVQLNASHAGVRDMLTQHAERLRLDLLTQNLQTVDVQVGQQGQRGNSDRSPLMMQTIAANALVPETEQEAPAETVNDRWLSTSA